MKFLNTTLLLILLSINFYGQEIITGQLLDSNTKKGLEYATVYINGTTVGTTTDQNGFFTLKVKTIPCQLIASHVSYETKALPILLKDKKLSIYLEPKNILIQKVSVKSKNRRDRNLKLFKDNFLGTDKWGENAILVNEEALHFKWDYKQEVANGITFKADPESISTITTKEKGKNQTIIKRPYCLKVTASEPLKIELPLLGFKLHVDLIDFSLEDPYSLKGSISSFLGYYYFNNIAHENKSEEQKINKNRLLAYYNSAQHFLKSVYEKDIHKNGYRIFEEGRNPKNFEKCYNEFFIDNNVVVKNSKAYVSGLNKKKLFVFFYSNYKGHPKDQNNHKGGRVIQSPIYFLNDTCVINSNGTISDNSIMFAPVIGNKKVGSLLPDNFTPEKIL